MISFQSLKISNPWLRKRDSVQNSVRWFLTSKSPLQRIESFFEFCQYSISKFSITTGLPSSSTVLFESLTPIGESLFWKLLLLIITSTSWQSKTSRKLFLKLICIDYRNGVFCIHRFDFLHECHNQQNYNKKKRISFSI